MTNETMIAHCREILSDASWQEPEVIEITKIALASLERKQLKACDACIDVLEALGINHETATLKQALEAVEKLKASKPAPELKPI